MKRLFRKRKENLNMLKIYRKRNNTLPKEVPDNIMVSCKNCNETILTEEFYENLSVCPKCNYHHRISAKERISSVFDSNYFKEFDADVTTVNSENFFQYDEKLDKARRNSDLNEAVVCGVAKIKKTKCVVCVMDSNFMMGSMGSVVGEKITRSIEYATKKKLPLIIFTASGGARMQEGILSLMQMAKTSSALKRHSDSKLLYITVLSDPTTGGVSASFAMLGDIIISEPNCLVGFAGKRVIEKTINETLPDEFQKSEFLLDKGFVDIIVERKKLRETIYNILTLHGIK